VAQERLRPLSERERGVALLLVLVALAAVLPLAIVLSELVIARHRQVNLFRENLAGQAIVRGALDVAMARLRSKQIAPEPNAEQGFEVAPESSRSAHVRVERQPDALLALDGRVLGPREAFGVDAQRIGVDPDGRVVRQFRRLEVYLVEAESPPRVPFPAVRLLAVVARLDGGEVVCIGVRYDRGYFR
jgi:hypothetical protein